MEALSDVLHFSGLTRRLAREGLRTTGDMRAVRTRRQLHEALERCLSRSPLEGLPTVVELTREAGVTRSAFYSHYADVAALALDRFALALERIAGADVVLRGKSDRLAREISALGSRRLVRLVFTERELFSALLDSAGSTTYEGVVGELAARSRTTLALEGRLPHGVDPVLASEFIAAGIVRVLALSIRSAAPLSEDELVEQLLQPVPSWFVEK